MEKAEEWEQLALPWSQFNVSFQGQFQPLGCIRPNFSASLSRPLFEDELKVDIAWSFARARGTQLRS